jgi:hypothetical protein
MMSTSEHHDAMMRALEVETRREKVLGVPGIAA